MVVRLCRWRTSTSSICLQLLCLLLLLSLSGGNSLGVLFGQDNSKLPTQWEVAQLLKSQQIKKVRLLNVDAVILQAFANTSVELMVGVQNEEVMDIGKSSLVAFSWVKENIVSHFPSTNITAIAVGSEVITSDLNLGSFLVQACQNIHAALLHFRLDSHIKVSSPHSLLVLGSSFPPSSGRFDKAYTVSIMQPFLSFLRETRSFFMVNVHPYYINEYLMQGIDLDFALLQPNEGLDDSKTKLHYSNILDALVDAVYSAMNSLNYSELSVVVTEIGWPLKGDPSEMAMPIENVALYHDRLIRHILSRSGTPMKPEVELVAYIHDMFNKVQRRGLKERKWGLVQSNGSQVYGISLMDPGQATLQKSSDRFWCVGRPWVSVDVLQLGLNWACGSGGANCNPIQLSEPCYVPNTVLAHASYAFNSYFQIHQQAPGTCDFGGSAMITNVDPSYPGCNYPFRAGQVGAPVGGTSMEGFHAEFALTLSATLVLLHFLLVLTQLM